MDVTCEKLQYEKSFLTIARNIRGKSPKLEQFLLESAGGPKIGQ